MARRKLLLTGIGEGLGIEIAGTFARAGYDVFGLSRSDRVSAAVSAMVERAGGHYTHLACDLAHPADISLLLQPIAEGHRCIDPQRATADDPAVHGDFG